jgi:hypothetical protein
MTDDLYQFRFVGGPLDNPSDALAVFQAIGHAAAAWSRLEQHIDALLIHVNKPTHSDTLYRPEHPVAFSGKLDLLKRWFGKHPALKKLAPHMGDLTSRLKPLGKERNRYLHSIIDDYDASKQLVTLRSVKYENIGNFRFSKQVIPLQVITTFSENVNSGNSFLWAMSADIFTEGALRLLEQRP